MDINGGQFTDANDALSLLNRAKDGVIVIQDGVFRYLNQSFADMLGYSPQELMNSAFIDYLFPEDVSASIERYERRLRGDDQPSVYEYTMRRKDGSGVPVEVNAVIVTYRDRPGDLVLIRDITARRLTQQALRDSERRYRLLAENLTDVIWTVDMDLRFTYVSPSVSKLRGYTAEEVMAQHVQEIFTPKSLELISSVVSEELARVSTGPYESRTVELEVYHRDGYTVWTEVKASFLRDEQGLPVGILGVARDISERRSAQDALRRAEKNYQRLADNALHIIWKMDMSGMFTYVSPAVHRYGYVPKDWIGRRMTEFLPPEEQAVFVERFARDCADPGSKYYEVRVLNKDGLRKWVEVLVDFDIQDGIPIGIQGIMRDIAGRKEIEEQLRESEERFRATFDRSPLGSAIASPGTGRFSRVNAEMCRILGYSEEELLDLGFAGITHPDHIEAELDLVAKLDSGEIDNYLLDKRLVHKDGKAVWVRLSVRIVRDAAGQPGYYLGVMQDVTEHKRAEDALRESESRYRGLIESQQDLIIRVSPDGDYIFVNDVYCRTFGKSREEFLGGTFWPLVYEADVEASAKAWEQALNPPYRSTVEQRALTVTGWRWFAWEDCAIRDEIGRVVEVQAVGRDIHDRKKAELELQESETRYRGIFDTAADGIIARTMDGTIVDANASYAQMLGYTPEELIGCDISKIIPPGYGEDVRRYREEIKKNGKAWIETANLAKDGRSIPVELSGIVVDLASGPLLFSIVRDISKRKRAEGALRESEARYRSIFDNAADGIVVRDIAGNVLDLNDAYCRMMGYTREELLGSNVTKVLHPDHPEDFSRYAADIVERGEARNDGVNITKDGNALPIELRGRFIRFGDQDAIFGIVRDIRARKRAEDELRKRAEKLEAQHRKLQATTEQKATFFTGMSHELRTPMTSIIGFTELLLEDIEDPVSRGQRELLLKVSNNSHRLLGMVNDLLDLSRMESGRMPISIEEVELARLISQIVANMSPLARDKNVKFLTPGKLSLPSVYTDEAKLSQILINLVSNAIKFTQSGKIEISAEVAGGKAIISVSDTGIGIAKKDLRLIFDEFHRVSEIGRKKVPGTGLGLAITKRLCKLLGGKISVASEVGVGSTFTVTLPNHQPKQQKAG